MAKSNFGAVQLDDNYALVLDKNGLVASGFITGSLGVADTAGGVLALANPLDVPIYVRRIVFDVTTKSTGACTLDVGVAANGTTSNDTLMDGLDVGTAAGVFDNIENQGTNGVATKKVAVGSYITASKASGAAAGLVGKYSVEFFTLTAPTVN